MLRIKLFGAMFTTLVVLSPAGADTFTYQFLMDGSQEVPPITSPATGFCTVTLNDSTNQVSVSCTYSGLTTNANNAHIHTGAPGVSGPPVVNLSFTAATSGTATVTNAPLSVANVNLMKAGNTYINIHSAMHGGGEIRGQVRQQVPAVSTWGMVATGVLITTAGTLALRRKKGVSAS